MGFGASSQFPPIGADATRHKCRVSVRRSRGKHVVRSGIRTAVEIERPLVTPLAHDALSARLIEMAGFRAFSIGGSAMLATRYALPDLGLAGLQEMAAGIADIAAVTSVPFIADGDDGYGDNKSVARMIAIYERLGVGGVLIEDQVRDSKQQRAERAVALVEPKVIEAKLRTALAVRSNPDTMIIGRTDAYGCEGLDAALKRAEGFLRAGVDGVFVAGIRRIEDYKRAGNVLKGAFLSAALFEGGATPWLTPAELGEMGYAHVSFPFTVIGHAAAAMRTALASLRACALGKSSPPAFDGAAQTKGLLDEALDVAGWRRLEATSQLRNNDDRSV